MLFLPFLNLEKTIFNKPVSVVVCAKNELDNLQKHLPTWLNQSYPDFELIIVNDESTDGSYEFLTNMCSEISNLKVVHIDKSQEQNRDLAKLKGKRYALRKGILSAESDYLLLTDADCFPVSVDWITEMTKAFSNSKIDVVLGYSPYIKKKGILKIEAIITH